MHLCRGLTQTTQTPSCGLSSVLWGGLYYICVSYKLTSAVQLLLLRRPYFCDFIEVKSVQNERRVSGRQRSFDMSICPLAHRRSQEDEGNCAPEGSQSPFANPLSLPAPTSPPRPDSFPGLVSLGHSHVEARVLVTACARSTALLLGSTPISWGDHGSFIWLPVNGPLGPLQIKLL